jgi:S-DNA-T family DNA segregation ATPase FtsK/SpoIIIE
MPHRPDPTAALTDLEGVPERYGPVAGAGLPDRLDAPLRLPDPPAAPRRGALPLVASAVPILGAVVLWAVTGTVMMLWFAALGPAIAAASLIDGARAARTARRRGALEAEGARRRVAAVVHARHDRERREAWIRHPDVLALTGDEARAGDIWRAGAGRGDELVVGRGVVRSIVQVDGGTADPASARLARMAAVLEDAPITVPCDAGIAVCGPEALARAVVRALALQACLLLPPDRLRVSPAVPARAEPWVARLPHAQPGHAARRLVLCEAGMPAPVGALVIARIDPHTAPPPGCAAVITVTGIDRARLDHDGQSCDIRIEGISREQAEGLANALAARAEAAYGPFDDDSAISLDELLPGSAPDDARDLRVTIAREHGAPFDLDLVQDGPHAVVAGMTGAGKSELLTSWITALCARFSTHQVTFLLADFKGGTAFDRLESLAHVTGVITDLDGAGARRALQSLRAELRRREAEIVRAGAQDVTGTRLARLVIVVDEYAALTWAHPELDAVFTDIAARGRALGMHLILGTQRASGTFRDALLANCPLRISLRVSDPVDSRVLVGTDAAAALSGDVRRRGMALVRRAADDAPHTVRIALTSAALVEATAAAVRGGTPRPTWLPALPERVTLGEAAALGGGPAAGLTRSAHAAGDLLLGIADDPERQRRMPAVLPTAERGLCVIGAAGSGRSTLLETIAAQTADPIWISRDAEAAWDLIARLADEPTAAIGRLVLADDVDALLTRFPAEYAQALTERFERLVYAAGAGGPRIVLALQRAAGAAGRLAELLPRRVILRCTTRAEFVAAGGAPGDFDAEMPPGRALIDGRTVQIAVVPRARPAEPAGVDRWVPHADVTAVVTRGGPLGRAVEATAAAAGARVMSLDEYASRGMTGMASGVAPGVGSDAATGIRPVVVIGDGEQWQRSWQALQAVRVSGDLLVDAACAPDYRMLTGERALAPYCEPGRGRAWLVRAGVPVVRVQLVLPADPR